LSFSGTAEAACWRVEKRLWDGPQGILNQRIFGALAAGRRPKRPINQYPLSASPLNDANLMAGLHAGDWVDTKPTEQGGGVESL
jgi:hypothetical protein